MTEHLTGHDGISSDNGDEQQSATGKYGRRALMLGAAAGVGAAASLAAKPEIAAAVTPDVSYVELGEANSTKGTTSVTSTKGDGLSGTTKANDYGGVLGEDHSSGGGFGVQGYSNAGTGLYGNSVGNSGVTNPDGYTQAGVIGDSNTNPGVLGTSSAAYGVYGASSANGGAGVYGINVGSSGGAGVTGVGPLSPDEGVGVFGISNYAGVSGLSVESSGITENPAGVVGDSTTNPGVLGTSSGENGVEGITTANGNSGVFGNDESSGGGYGLYGNSTNGNGVQGVSHANGKSGVVGEDQSSGGGNGVYASSTNGTGVSGNSTGGYGVYGSSTGEDAIHGYTTANHRGGVSGIDASSGGGYGVYGSSDNGSGVFGITNAVGLGLAGVYAYGNGDSIGLYAYNGPSSDTNTLIVDGSAAVTGVINKGGGSFKIDHPLDPAGKYLYHSFVESPDMMNVYNGTVTLNADGKATVELPDWFEVLNRDYRYQLTAIGSPAPELHISREVKDGTFSIGGGRGDQKVSWQVTGIRQDAWADANRIPVEVDKPAEDQGRYLHPELFGGEPITIMARARGFARRHEATRPVSRQTAQP